MNLDMPSATLLVGMAAGIAAIVATGGNLLNDWLIRRSEERRQIRDLAVRAATEELIGIIPSKRRASGHRS